MAVFGSAVADRRSNSLFESLQIDLVYVDPNGQRNNYNSGMKQYQEVVKSWVLYLLLDAVVTFGTLNILWQAASTFY